MDEPAPRPIRPILLVGMPGSGKSTIAPLLAAHLGRPAHDVDALVETRLGMSIARIFARHGERGFRAEEKELIAALLAGPAAVIAAGGGAFLDPETRALVLERGYAIWLDADLVTLTARGLDGATRPLLAEPGRLAALKASRDPVYALAQVRVDAGQPPDAIVAAIVTALAEPAR
ncbi:MAG: shikimate kinase [Sphingomonas sp.]